MNARVLIVDDSLTVRMDLADSLGEAGLEVTVAATIADAHAALVDGVFPLIVLDVLLPDGDGIELLAELRAHPVHRHAQVMLLSTEAEVSDRIRGLATGADEYVGKPYDTSYVIGRAHELLRRAPGATASSVPTIVLIDDSPLYREVLRDALVAAGYCVLTASGGEEGLRIAADVRPNAIIVDGLMPGIDGATVIRRARLDTVLRRTPCLLLTGSDDATAEIRAFDVGADAFVRKEQDVGILLGRLAVVLRSAAHSDDDYRPSTLGPKKILAVDDSKTYLHEVASMLRIDGYDVVLAQNGEEALAVLGVETVDCILLDLIMPGLGGNDVCRRIKLAAGLRETPVIMLTAVDDRASMLESLAAGADDYIAKSTEFDVLRARVRAQIRRRQVEDEHRHVRERLLRSEHEAIEAQAARELAETRAALLDDLRRKNEELEAFSYSVSHDLRAPVRRIEGFARVLLERHADGLGPDGQKYLRRVSEAAAQMEELICALLELSRITRAELRRTDVDLSALAERIVANLRTSAPDRDVQVDIVAGLVARADPGLMAVVLENLLGNAWKFTRNRPGAHISFGASQGARPAYCVRDNGAGFDAAHAEKMFSAFQRLHAPSEFEGTGIGLATVHRIVDRHGGQVWAEGVRDAGASFHFTIGDEEAGR